MSLSLRQEISKRVISPAEYIEQAEKDAHDAASLLEEKQASEGNKPFELNPDDEIDKKAENLLSGIDDYLDNPPKESPKSEKSAEEKNKGGKRPEKSAAAKVIQTGIADDVLRLGLDEKVGEEGDEPSKFDINSIDIRALNEKVAFDVKKIVKPALGVAGGAGLLGAGAVAGNYYGQSKGKQKLKNYVAADQVRDKEVANRAFVAGQQTMLEKIRAAMSRRKVPNG